MPRAIGAESARAVIAASCCGEKFLADNMKIAVGDCRHRCRKTIEIAVLYCYYLANTALPLHFEFITDTLYCSDTVKIHLLPDLSYVNINCSVTNDNLCAPNLIQNLVA